MATVNKSTLLSQLGRIPGMDSNGKAKALEVNTELLDTVMCSTYSNGVNTVSGSGNVDISLIQPANTVLEDIVCICTSQAQRERSAVTFIAGTTAGASDILTSATNSLADTGTSVAAGQGSSIHQKIQTSLQGGAPFLITAGAGYTSTERTIHGRVSMSIANGGAGFQDGNGTFKVIGKYYNL